MIFATLLFSITAPRLPVPPRPKRAMSCNLQSFCLLSHTPLNTYTCACINDSVFVWVGESSKTRKTSYFLLLHLSFVFGATNFFVCLLPSMVSLRRFGLALRFTFTTEQLVFNVLLRRAPLNASHYAVHIVKSQPGPFTALRLAKATAMPFNGFPVSSY